MRVKPRPKGEAPSDHYFFMWNLTEKGLQNPEGVRDSLRRASAMVQRLGGSCQLFVSIGGRYEMVGVAEGIDDTKAAELLHAVNALGTIRTTTFLKTRDFYLADYEAFAKNIKGLLDVKL